MGAGTSSDPADIEDDEMGVEYDDVRGVVKHIPIEVKPRGKLGVRSGRSSSKQKGSSSLRSALSVDVTENPEVEKVYKEFEMYRMKCDNEVANMLKKEQKLETENRKLRAELQALQKMCKKQRDERDSALEAEHRALMRAAAIEADRDKVQRQFKIFRETKEGELQNLLRAKRRLESRLAKLGSSALEDSETSSRLEIGFGNIGDWWSTMDNELVANGTLQSLPSTTTTINASSSICKGPEFARMPCEGPYITIRKDDWQQASVKLNSSLSGVETYVPANVVRIFVSSSTDLEAETELLCQKCRSRLKRSGAASAQFVDVIHLLSSPEANGDANELELYSLARCQQLERCSVFIAVVDGASYQNVENDIDLCLSRYLPKKLSIFCSRISREQCGNSEMLKKLTASSESIKTIFDCDSIESTVEQIYVLLEDFLQQQSALKPRESVSASALSDDTARRTLLGSVVWDETQEFEQLEAWSRACRATTDIGFDKYYEQLNAHVSSAGPLPPLLVCGDSGSGKSLLLAKWMEQLQYKTSALLLHHFVGKSCSSSADPTLMIRRLTAQLMQHVTCPPALTSDPVRLMSEFPKWIERVSSRIPGGIILVVDSVDHFQKCDTELMWLVDPLPVDLRVIVSVHPDTCPVTWKSWPSLMIPDLNGKNVRDLLRSELSCRGIALSDDDEEKILCHCRTVPSVNPLYVVILAAYLARCQLEKCFEAGVESVRQATNVETLYRVLLQTIITRYDTEGIVRKVLLAVFVSHNGISESELFDIIPTLTWNVWSPILFVLLDWLFLTHKSGLLVFAHDQVRETVTQMFLSTNDNSSLLGECRLQLIDYFSDLKRSGCLVHRTADELPYLYQQSADGVRLEQCLINPFIFVHLYARGHCAELISYWQFLGTDKVKLASIYFASVKEMEDTVRLTKDVSVTFPDVADVYESVGRFLSDFGLISEALTAHQRSLEIREMSLDPEHVSIACSLHLLAELHTQQGKLMTAEMLYRQALEIYEGAVGRDDILYGRELSTLAIFYQKQGKHELAEPLHKEAKAILQKHAPQYSTLKVGNKLVNTHRPIQLGDLTFGADTVEVARTLNEIGVLHYLQNDTNVAETLLKRSLQIRESLLPADHPDLAQSLNNLAALYSDLKRYELAVPLYERALEIRRKHFPIEHPSVASLFKNLGMILKKMGQLDKAVEHYSNTVESTERCFGAGHPSVATALVNLGVLYSQLGKLTAAEPLFERALTIYEETLDPCHPRVSETLRNMALLKYEQGDFETAARLYKRSTEIRDNDSVVACESGKVASNCSSSNDTRSTLCLPERQPAGAS